LEHDEDPDVSSVTIAATGNNVNTEYGVDFPTPTGNPTVGADLQEFRAGVEEFDAGQTGTPQARIELWENGSLVRAGTDTNVSTYAVLAFTWNANELGTADGSLVQCKVIGSKSGGSPGARNTVDIGHIEWNVTYDAGTTFFETLAASTTATTGLTTATIFGESLAASTTATPVMSQVPTFVVPMVVVATGVVGFVKKMFVTMAVVTTATPVLTKKMFMTLAVVASAVPGLTTALLSTQSLVATALGIASLATLKIVAGADTLVRKVRCWLGLGLGM
jgi:hypothetical protein